MIARVGLVALALIAPVAAYAAPADCVSAIAIASRRYRVPPILLYAVAVTESGHPTARGIRPNPYAVDVDGRGYAPTARPQAIAIVKTGLKDGHREIDVGCLQVDLRWHPHAFASVAAGFDPTINVDYGARFLRRLYDRYGNWTSAVAFYHSPAAGAQWGYVCAVYRRLVQYGMAAPGRCRSLMKIDGGAAFRP